MWLGSAPERLGKLAHATKGGVAGLLWRDRERREVQPAGATEGEADVHGHAHHGRGGGRPWQGRRIDMAAAREARHIAEGAAAMAQCHGGGSMLRRDGGRCGQQGLLPQ